MNEKKSLLQLLQEKNQFVNAPCGGMGKCRKCAVKYLYGASEPTERDWEVFSKEQIAQGFRLACCSYPENDYQIEMVYSEEKISVQTLWNGAQISKEPQKTAQRFQIAIDIGTTTIAALLLDETAETILNTASVVNHQRIYGADVLSRIQASNNGKKWEMQSCIRRDLKNMILELAEKQKILLEQIIRIAIAGNTTMFHLLLGFSCETLGRAPFCPVDLSMIEKDASVVLGMAKLNCKAVLFPGISAFVGADITAGIAACEIHTKENYQLFLDIGTNGEIALANKTHIYVTSASAGPAFEGGSLSCGMAGVEGAVAHVKLNAEKLPQLKLIGQAQKPIGICGTGVIDLVSELLTHHIIDENGTLTDEFFDTGFPISDTLFFLQKDIREVQMAKAAVRAGIEILLKKAGISVNEIEHCYLAGGFGSQINLHHAAVMGLLPPQLEHCTTAAGNTVLAGLKQYLAGNVIKQDLEQITALAETISLAEESRFQELYLNEINFEQNG